jgi:hypothetical protein
MGCWRLAPDRMLIVVFGGDSHALIPLFASGVFLAFTLSQAGMVVHWARTRGPAWKAKSLINGIGALITAGALSIIIANKFLEGAWIVALLVPLLVLGFRSVERHYREVARELTLSGLPPSLKPLPEPRIVIPISGCRGVIEALRAPTIRQVTAVYVETDPGKAEARGLGGVGAREVPLVVIPSPYRSLVGPFLDYLDETDQEHHDGQLATVLLPEFVPARWWHHLLHNQSAVLMRLAMLYGRRRLGYTRAIIDIPFHLRK